MVDWTFIFLAVYSYLFFLVWACQKELSRQTLDTGFNASVVIDRNPPPPPPPIIERFCTSTTPEMTRFNVKLGTHKLGVFLLGF